MKTFENAAQFIQAIRHASQDDVQELINVANDLGLDFAIMDTQDFLDYRADHVANDPDELVNFAKIARDSNLTFSKNYIREGIYDFDYKEADTFLDLLTDSDLSDIYDAYIESPNEFVNVDAFQD